MHRNCDGGKEGGLPGEGRGGGGGAGVEVEVNVAKFKKNIYI